MTDVEFIVEPADVILEVIEVVGPVLDVIEAPEVLFDVLVDETVFEIIDADPILDVIETSIPGRKGDKGDQGDPGLSGGSFEHTQSLASATWTITHNLGFRPAVTTFDSLDRQVIGELAYPDENTVVVTFLAGFSGHAFLS